MDYLLFARLKDGNAVGESIRKMLSTCIKDNLLDTHPPFQIDGNFGAGEAILESLAQSHSGYLEFLPALPENWDKGAVSGMILRGGIQADFSWENGKLKTLTLTAKDDREVIVRIDGTEETVFLKKDLEIKIR